MHVNDHKIQDIGVRKCIYIILCRLSISHKIKIKNQHD